MTTFTQDERTRLYAKFPLADHEHREGPASSNKEKRRWFTYIRRGAIQTLLDDLFFGEWDVDYSNHIVTGNVHTVQCTITIRGASRAYNGSQVADSENDEHAAKGAYTDAFKRAASMWGIGLYLQDAPNIWTENPGRDWGKRDACIKQVEAQFAKWLNGVKPAAAPPPQPTTPAPHWTTDPKRVGGFFSWASNTYTYTQADCLRALGVQTIADYTGTDAEAVEAVKAYDPLAVEQKPLVDAPAKGSSNYAKEDS